MHNLNTVINFEFFRAIKKLSFWLSILVFPVLIAIIGGVSYFSSIAADNAQQNLQSTSFTVGVLDRSGIVTKSAEEDIQAKNISTKETGIGQVKNGKLDAFIYYPDIPTKKNIEIYARDKGLLNNSVYQGIATELLRKSALSSVASPERLAIINQSSAIQTTFTAYKNGKIVPGFESVIAPGIFLVLFYMLILLMGNEMLASTTEEKENRVIEMILTTVTAKTLLFGKIISLIMLSIVRLLVIIIPSVLVVFFFGKNLSFGQIDFAHLVVSPEPVIVGTVLFILSFLLFTGLLVTIGAVMPSAKEASRFFGIAIFSLFVPFYAAQAIVSDPSQVIVKVFTFFPLTAPITLMLRNAVGNLAPWELAVGMAILALSTTVLLFSAAQAFRYGALEYSRRLSLKEIFGRP
jgi:ABC-2 type transport system permease protein